MAGPTARAHRGGRPYPRKPQWGIRPLAQVEEAVAEWCRRRGLDPTGRGVRSDAINSLVMAGAAANPRGVDITREHRAASRADLDAPAAPQSTADGDPARSP